MKNNLKSLLLKFFGIKTTLVLKNIYVFFFFKFKDGLKGLLKNKKKKYFIENLSFKFPKSNLWDYGTNFKYYELNERNLVKKYIEKNDKVLELGGSIGVVSCYCNRILDHKQHVVLEPNPQVIPYLKGNKELNSCKFAIEQKVISQSEDEIQFNQYDNYLSSSLIDKKLSGTKITVQTTSIESLKEKYSTIFDTLIMDIEGGEYDFIIQNNLDDFKKLIIEFHPSTLSQNQLDKCREKLIQNSFFLKEVLQNVEYWCK